MDYFKGCLIGMVFGMIGFGLGLRHAPQSETAGNFFGALWRTHLDIAPDTAHTLDQSIGMEIDIDGDARDWILAAIKQPARHKTDVIIKMNQKKAEMSLAEFKARIWPDGTMNSTYMLELHRRIRSVDMRISDTCFISLGDYELSKCSTLDMIKLWGATMTAITGADMSVGWKDT